jgi:hypothetical protein
MAKQSTTKGELMQLIKNIWKGDEPLGITFWVYGAVPYVFMFAGFMIAEIENLHWGIPVAISVLWLVYSPFINISVWRSATKSPKVLIPRLVKLYIIVWWIAYVGLVAGIVFYLSQWAEQATI